MKARVKCVALSRMVYGDDDWCHARSLLMLATAYHEHGGESNVSHEPWHACVVVS